MLAPTYALIDADGKKIIEPDGTGEFDMKGNTSVSTYPIEQGGFQSYNKVLTPKDLSLSLQRARPHVSRGVSERLQQA